MELPKSLKIQFNSKKDENFLNIPIKMGLYSSAIES